MPDRDAKKTTDPAENLPLSSPYGPQYRGVDEAAGGADSSPYENVPTGEREDQAAAPPNRNRGTGGDLNR
jgi:hypothetical protein